MASSDQKIDILPKGLTRQEYSIATKKYTIYHSWSFLKFISFFQNVDKFVMDLLSYWMLQLYAIILFQDIIFIVILDKNFRRLCFHVIRGLLTLLFSFYLQYLSWEACITYYIIFVYPFFVTYTLIKQFSY
jgi:hypothetical protein